MRGGSQTYDGVDDLVGTIEREVDFLCSQCDHRLLIGLPKFVRFLQREPRLSSLVAELEREANAGRTQFEATRKEIRSALRSVWLRLKPLVLLARGRQSQTDRLAFEEDEDFEEVERSINSDDSVEPDSFQYRNESDYDTRSAFASGEGMQRLTGLAGIVFKQLDGTIPEEIGEIERALAALQVQATYCYRRYWLDERTLAGYSYGRLEYVTRWINPEPRAPDTNPLEHAGHMFLAKEWTDAVYSFSGSAPGESSEEIKREADKVRRDLKLLYSQLRSNIVLGRANIGLLRRFAARCERFHADELREIAMRDTRSAEAKLRDELACFMFDNGLNPLLETSVANLRPDILNAGQPIYVEVKQYRGSGVKTQVIRGFRQVLDTRGRLRNSFRDLSEAFLAVFRVDGPRVEFPEVVQVHGGKVFMVLVDIAPGTKSGSRQSQKPILLTEQELLDAGEG